MSSPHYELLVHDSTLATSEHSTLNDVPWQEILAIKRDGELFGHHPKVEEMGIGPNDLTVHDMPFQDPNHQQLFLDLLRDDFYKENNAIHPAHVARMFLGYEFDTNISWNLGSAVAPNKLVSGNAYVPVIYPGGDYSDPRIATARNELLMTTFHRVGDRRLISPNFESLAIGFIAAGKLIKATGANKLHKIV